MSFYELQAPTEWVEPPAIWSSTSIDDIDNCPRRWQLLRSRWGEHSRFPTRPSPAAVEGQIVHEALDNLTRACGQRGNPALGTAEFSAALVDADFFPSFVRAVAEWHEQFKSHPRSGPAFRLRASAEELANRAVRMFREQYKPDSGVAVPAERAPEPSDLKTLLRVKHALSEVRLEHPSLPFVGVLDRVQQIPDGVEIVDFKTGKPSDKHHRQLLRYAVLWWRATGEVPTRVSAQYLNGIESWKVSRDAVIATETEIKERIKILTEELAARPAAAKVGNGCKLCPVRSRCAVGWLIGEEAAQADGRGDAELTATQEPGDHGFLARLRSGAEVAVVYEAAIWRLVPSGGGHILRVLDGVWKEKRSQLEIKAWSEIFVVRDE